jgi:O-antigen ligase
MTRSIAQSLTLRESTPLRRAGRRLDVSRSSLGRFIPAGVAILTGFLLATHSLLTVLLVATIVIVIALARIPWLPYVLISASVATFAFYAGWPELLGIKVPELLLAAALVATGAHIGRGESRGPSVHTSLIALFLLATAGGAYVGLRHGATFDEAVKGMRPMVFYAAFWPAFVVAADTRWRMLVMRLGAVVVPVIVGIQLVQIHVGPERPLFAFTSVVEHVTLTPQLDGFLRVRPPGLTLIYIATLFAAAYLLWGPRRHRLGTSFVCAAGALGVLVSLNRNMIIGIVVGLTLAAVVVPRRNRFLLAALVCTLFALASFSLWETDRRAGVSGSVIQRVLSIGDISELRAGTLSDRSYENRFALRVVKSEPVTGIGWGTPYGARLTEYRDGRLVTEPRGFLHQQYLWIWMRTGLVGLLALLLLLGLALAFAARWSRRRAWDDESGLGPAVLASVTAFAASATVGTYLTNPESIVVLMGVLALAYALRSEAGADKRETRL